MTKLPREVRLRNLLRDELSLVADCLDGIHFRRKKSSVSWLVSSLRHHAYAKAMYAYFIDGEADGLRQWSYVASRLALQSVGKTDGSEFGYAAFLCALLSDNDQVIQAMARVTTKQLHQAAVRPTYGAYMLNMFQIAMRGEDDLLPDLIDKLGKHGKKPWRQEAALRQDFYSLLMARDQAGLQQLIQERHAKINAAVVPFEDFISLIATCETKLCWRRGIEVQIDSPLVPMALMPVKPLAHYDPVYDFLDPGWKPPIQGWLGRLLHRMRQRSW